MWPRVRFLPRPWLLSYDSLSIDGCGAVGSLGHGSWFSETEVKANAKSVGFETAQGFLPWSWLGVWHLPSRGCAPSGLRRQTQVLVSERDPVLALRGGHWWLAAILA